jgi:hypothetical protein
VEESKFCLFSVVLTARCVSSISPRFHYRRHAFCFLPVAAILESHSKYFIKNYCIYVLKDWSIIFFCVCVLL